MIANNKAKLFYLLGGSTCAGKTTISKILSEKYGFTVYPCDEYLGKHVEKSNAKEHPNLNRAKNISWDEILSMKTEDYLNWIIGLYSEEFDMILEDLDHLSDGKPILVEGVNLLPQLIKDHLIDEKHVFFVVSDDIFYQSHQIHRKEFYERINSCTDSEQALISYKNFDLAFGKYILKEAERLDFQVLVVGNESDLLKNIEMITSYYHDLPTL